MGSLSGVPIGFAKMFLAVCEYIVLDGGGVVAGDSGFSRAARSENEYYQNK